MSFEIFSGGYTPDTHNGRGRPLPAPNTQRKRPGVGTQILVPLNFSAVVAPLRPTTRKRVHLVTSGHFWTRDKDGGHTIRSTISINPMLHANLTALCFIEPQLWPIKVLHYGDREL